MFETTSNPPTGSTPTRNSEVLLFEVHGHNWRWGTEPDGTPWAVAADVARSFDYASAQKALQVIDADEKGSTDVVTPSGVQRMGIIYEDGLWELVFRSSKPEAKALKKRIKEILHQLRTGEMKLVSMQDPLAELERQTQLTTRAIEIAKAERTRADAAEGQLAVAAPKAEHWDVLASAEGDLSVADAAKILSRDPVIKTGERRLFNTMGTMGWAFRQRGDQKWRAYQKTVDSGWLSELPQTHYNPQTGVLQEDAPQVRVTTKGLAELRSRLGGSVELPIAA